jgi:hypothetical protein
MPSHPLKAGTGLPIGSGSLVGIAHTFKLPEKRPDPALPDQALPLACRG